MRALPMIRSLRAAVFLSVLMLIPLFIAGSSPFTAVYAIVLSVLIGPALLCMTALWAGLLPAAVGWIAMVMSAWLPFGQEAGLRMALYLAPGMGAFLLCVWKKVPFFRTALLVAAGGMAGGFMVLLIMNQRAGGMLAQQMAEQFTQLIKDSGMQDELLLSMLQTGLARLDPSLYSQARGLFGGLSELGREELLLSLKATLTDMLSLMPALLVSQCIWNSLTGLGIGIYFGRRAVIHTVVDRRRQETMRQVLEQRRIQLEHGEVPNPVRLEGREQMLRELSGDCEKALGDFPTLQMPPFSLWHLPRGIGLMAALPGLGLLVPLVTDSQQAYVVGAMLGGIFTTLYSIQGMAAVDYLLGHGDKSLGVRCAILAVVRLLFSQVFLFIGIADQLFNFRKLRKPLGEGLSGGE